MIVLLLMLALKQGRAQTGAEVRRPRGIYALILVDLQIAGQQTANPSITTAQLHSHLRNIYSTSIANPAVSGLALELGWKMLNPNPPSSSQPYDWSWLDDAFSVVAAWNATNPAAAPKTIQVGLGAGYTAPSWLMDQLSSCDALFMSPPQTPAAACGTATFLGFSEGGGGVLPLPWNAAYKSAFATFLAAFAGQYGSNPALVSVDIAGPSAASTETILPDNANTPAQSQFGGIEPNKMWAGLLAVEYPGQKTYQNSDQAFIDQWNAATDLYGTTFNNLTLLLWAEPGLPSLGATGFTVAGTPGFLKNDCPTVDMGCAAITMILSHLVSPSSGGNNAKATSTAALTALSGGNLDLSISAVKLLSQSTAALSAPSTQILGGQQGEQSIALRPVHEGCTAAFPPARANPPSGCTIPSTCTFREPDTCPAACLPQACMAPGVTLTTLQAAGYQQFGDIPAKDLISPEQALYNVLNVYFDGTPVGSSFGGATGTAPLNYLQLYWNDIQYATAHASTPVVIAAAGDVTIQKSFQDLLNLASQQLLSISEPAPMVAEVANAEGESPVIAPNTWVEIKGSNLAPPGFDRIWSNSDFVNNALPTALNGAGVTVNGKSAYIYYVSPDQINILTPPDAMSGSIQVQVTASGQTASFTAQAQALSPSFFVFNGGPYVAAVHTNGSLIGPATLYPGSTTPAKPGEIILIYANGFGPANVPVVGGASTQSGALSPLPLIQIGGVNATVLFAGLVAPGEFQFNVIVPPSLADGDHAIAATYGGFSTQSGTLITTRQ